ncbi:hypothetical protein DXG01_011837 [Tephrocybe rancida]|nr:hypothetical protein DXG01_011837 [Tephrocybe rancida]
MFGPQSDLLRADPPFFDDFSQSKLQSPTTSTFSTRTHTERLNDPSASMLDLDDDPRRSVASDYDNDDHSRNNEDENLSYLGPNLRFHSRAPWETDDAAFDNDDDEETNYAALLPSKKAFGFSSSPRTSNARRPSVESTRSQAKSKQSFETSSSQMSYPRGALYALAQESLSTSSLGASLAAQNPPRSKFMNRAQPDSPNIVPPSSATHSNHTPLNPHTPHDTDTRIAPTPHRRPTHAADDFHPYANPDLVSQASNRHHSPPKQYQGISRSDSIGTVTDSVTHISLSRSGTRSTLAPVTSMLSVNARNRASTIQGREISSPISVVNAHRHDSISREEPFHQSGVDSLPGWSGRGTTPGFSLISLEEARAQRVRSATAQPSMPVSPPSVSAPSTDMSFPSFHESDNRGYDAEYGDFSPHNQRGRARSISAGVKAKGALQNIVGGAQAKLEAEPGYGKMLKHKKSGFMRLFNGGRGQDKEEKLPPPPVPSLSDAYAALNVAQKAPKGMSYRIPVPDLSPSPPESYLSPERTPSPVDLTAAPSKPSPSPKRPIPPLSINTRRQSYGSHAHAVDDDDFQTRTAPSTNAPYQPWLNASNPQSAPANVTEFPALKLRPVSTVFSAQFGDHIVLPDSRPSLETDFGTPGSSTKVFSPITPGSSTLSDRSSAADPKSAFMSSISEDQSSVVSALQEQILNAKHAWQRQIWELESQVRDLKAEVDDLRKVEDEGTFCENCGRGQRRPKVLSSPLRQPAEAQDGRNLSVVNRPRARTGISSRFGSAVS